MAYSSASFAQSLGTAHHWPSCTSSRTVFSSSGLAKSCRISSASALMRKGRNSSYRKQALISLFPSAGVFTQQSWKKVSYRAARRFFVRRPLETDAPCSKKGKRLKTCSLVPLKLVPCQHSATRDALFGSRSGISTNQASGITVRRYRLLGISSGRSDCTRSTSCPSILNWTVRSIWDKSFVGRSICKLANSCSGIDNIGRVPLPLALSCRCNDVVPSFPIPRLRGLREGMVSLSW